VTSSKDRAFTKTSNVEATQKSTSAKSRDSGIQEMVRQHHELCLLIPVVLSLMSKGVLRARLDVGITHQESCNIAYACCLFRVNFKYWFWVWIWLNIARDDSSKHVGTKHIVNASTAASCSEQLVPVN